MSAKEFYAQEYGHNVFLLPSQTIALMEKFVAHLKLQKPDDDSHLRRHNYSEERSFENHAVGFDL